jgi:phage-related protein/DNA-binding XRE family transcriptional regulator
MNRTRDILYFKDYFLDFYEEQSIDVQKKFDWTLDLIREFRLVPEQYLSSLEGAPGLYEVRVTFGGRIFRVFCIFEEGNLIVLFHGFEKKTQKTPPEKLNERFKFNENIMIKRKKVKLLTSFDEHLDEKYGKKGTPTRNQYEAEYEAFKLGVLLQEARKRKSLTQEQLAKRVGTTKNYISRIENDASDIRLGTLMRIVNGLGGQLTLTV